MYIGLHIKYPLEEGEEGGGEKGGGREEGGEGE